MSQILRSQRSLIDAHKQSFGDFGAVAVAEILIFVEMVMVGRDRSIGIAWSHQIRDKRRTAPPTSVANTQLRPIYEINISSENCNIPFANGKSRDDPPVVEPKDGCSVHG